MDVHGSPELRPRIDLVGDLVRATTIQSGHVKIHTVEHVLSALSGCGVDNALIEMDASEPPIMDGSARPFVNLILQAEIVEQELEREYFELDAPVIGHRGQFLGHRAPVRSPEDFLHVGGRPRHPHPAPVVVDRSRCLPVAGGGRADVHDLRGHRGIAEAGQDPVAGRSIPRSCIRGDKILSKEPLRFKDEFVRHKILDIIGDIALLGLPLKAHIVATRPGHAINAELTKLLFGRLEERKKGGARRKAARPAAR
jgi:UDP-3-O-[3-hydroxymyristoyl] N-acetylglucosamine deacetylase/3-hydroxyacyl-[acyl-carrier-protein] dehydratase